MKVHPCRIPADTTPRICMHVHACVHMHRRPTQQGQPTPQMHTHACMHMHRCLTCPARATHPWPAQAVEIWSEAVTEIAMEIAMEIWSARATEIAREIWSVGGEQAALLEQDGVRVHPRPLLHHLHPQHLLRRRCLLLLLLLLRHRRRRRRRRRHRRRLHAPRAASSSP